MLRGFSAALAKDLKLLLRDRVGLIFLTIAPVVVITVAGFSLASLYGGDSRGTGAYLFPVADEDGGRLGERIRDVLAQQSWLEVRPVASREEARVLVRSHAAGAALIVPQGTTATLAGGQPAPLLLFTDPVKYLEVAKLRAAVQELRHAIEASTLERASRCLERARERALAARARFERRAATLERKAAAYRGRLATVRSEAERNLAAERTEGEHRARDALAAAAERETRAQERIVQEIAAVRGYLVALGAARQELDAWLAELRAKAGPLASRIPPPPAAPEPPPEVRDLESTEPRQVLARLLPDATGEIELAAPAHAALPQLPEPPAIELPRLPEPPALRLPGALEIEETSVTGASEKLNTFDQNVPGFSVTFLLLGVLLGISLGLLDERDWGTLARLRATETPFAIVLVAKLTARFAVGVAQMAILFFVGWLVFGVSLGPEPWALALPTCGIVFAGTAFGLIVAGAAPSREAVLPLGSMAIITMAAVGGCWWPIDLEPPWMRQLALAFPTTWAMAAYNDLMIRRQPLDAALRPSVVLLGFGVIYLMLGLVLFNRQARRSS